MNTPASKPDPFEKLLDTYVEELQAMSGEEALGSLDPAVLEKEGAAMLERARAAAGQRRLAAARLKLAQERSEATVASGAVGVTAQEARHFLAQAANDGRYTLAARELREMSDDEALRLYEQFKRLEGRQTPPSDRT